MQSLSRLISAFTPLCPQEETDRAIMLSLLSGSGNLLLRDTLPAHFTASGLVVNPARTETVFAYHRIYDSYAWLGGHADGEADLLAVARREVQEESGLFATPVQETPLSLEILTVDGHIRRGVYVPSHLHLNLTFLFEADPAASLTIAPMENLSVRWFPLEDALRASTEPWMVEHVYRKLFSRLS